MDDSSWRLGTNSAQRLAAIRKKRGVLEGLILEHQAKQPMARPAQRALAQAAHSRSPIKRAAARA